MVTTKEYDVHLYRPVHVPISYHSSFSLAVNLLSMQYDQTDKTFPSKKEWAKQCNLYVKYTCMYKIIVAELCQAKEIIKRANKDVQDAHWSQNVAQHGCTALIL